MQLVNNNRPTRTPQRAVPQQPRRKMYVEDYQPINLQYDDDVPTFGDYGDEPERITISRPVPKAPGSGMQEVLVRLENIENKLTKLEGMIRTAVIGGQQPISSTPTQSPAPMMMESVAQPVVPRQGSMLGEIQSVIAQQGGVQPEMTFNRPQQPGGIPQVPQMQPDMVTSVGTLAPNVYDDDIGDIEAFG